METKQEKLQRLIKMQLTHTEKRSYESYPRESLYDVIESLRMGIDTILQNYIDCIEFMTNEDFRLFTEFQNLKYNSNEKH